MKPRIGKTLNCRTCGKEFYCRPSSTKRYCSYECLWHSKKTNMKLICKHCGKLYYRANSQVKHRGTAYCSNECKYNGKEPTRTVLDTLWSKAIHERDKCCRHCRKTNSLNAHHIFTRSRFNTRWNLENGILLCSGCHKLSSVFSAHGTPRKFFAWLETIHNKEWLDNLERTSDMVAKGIDKKMYKVYLINELKKHQ